MRQRKIFWLSCGIAACLVCLCWLLAPESPAQNINMLQRQRQQIQRRIQDSRSRVKELRKQESSARRRVDILNDNIDVTETRLADNQYRLEQAKLGLQQAQQQLDELETKLKRQQAGTAARLRYLQRQGADQWWSLLLSSTDLNQFFDRRHQLQLLIRSDWDLVADLQETAKAVQEQRLALEGQKNEISLITQQLARQKDNLEDQVVAQENLMQRLATERAAYEAAQRQLETDSRRLAGLIKQVTGQRGRAGDPVQSTGRLQRPVNGPLTSGFGWRIHPIHGGRRFHAGIDFGVPTGTPVRSANRGTVILAGWYGGFGHTVVVNHGGGISTLYAHNSRLAVNVGQVVQRGQVVAQSGSTGLSTGPHVHFEVRINGEPVNPLRHL